MEDLAYLEKLFLYNRVCLIDSTKAIRSNTMSSFSNGTSRLLYCKILETKAIQQMWIQSVLIEVIFNFKRRIVDWTIEK